MKNVGQQPPDGIDPQEWIRLVEQWLAAAPAEQIGARNLRALMAGLSRECPFGGNPEECCLYTLRQKPFRERVDWVMQLSDTEIEVIYQEHRKCSRNRSHCPPELEE